MRSEESILPYDNEWQVPVLDVGMQAAVLDLPFECWGRVARSKRMPGTWHFYTGDDRFRQLAKTPDDLLKSNCVAAVEPNFSCWEQTPRAVALHRIYQKRWVARMWQLAGVRIFVDLNVAAAHRDLNMLGVPFTWRSYATRGYDARLDETEREYEAARSRAGSSDILFLVYGGGAQTKQMSLSRGWLWMPEQFDKVNGRKVARDGEG